MRLTLSTLTFLSLSIPGLATPLPSPWAPSVRVSEHRIVGRPADSHHSISGIGMVIQDQERCEAKVVSVGTIEFSDTCQLLQGYYKYAFQAEGSTTGREVYIEFLLSRIGDKSKISLINSPIYVENGKPVLSNLE